MARGRVAQEEIPQESKRHWEPITQEVQERQQLEQGHQSGDFKNDDLKRFTGELGQETKGDETNRPIRPHKEDSQSQRQVL